VKYGLYEVTQNHTYRGRAAGEQFEGRMDRGAEARAVMRGVIRLIDTLTPALVPGSYVFPRGWLASPHTPVATEAPRGASFIGRSRSQ
jgi:hypothetical protein